MGMYAAVGVIALIAFLLGVAIGMYTSTNKTNGTLVINEHSKDKPFFELHFTEDPKKLRSGESLVFKLDMR